MASRDVHVTHSNKRKADVNNTEDAELFRASAHMEKAMELHKQYPCIDGHNDLPWALKVGFNHQLGKVDLSKNLTGVKFDKIRHQCLHTDIPRCREGGMGAQLWSVYIPFSSQGTQAVQDTLEQIDVVHRLCEKYPETFEYADNSKELMRIFKEGKIASLMGAEGGHQINDSLACLRMYHRLGVRYMTLTHNGGPVWADPALEYDGTWVKEPKVGGLSAFGVEVVKEMNRIGMMVDISHVHETCMNRVLDVTRAPVIFSHSSSKALCDHPRDVPDDVVLRTQKNGGVIMINFCANFIAGPFWCRGGMVGATLLEVADHIDHIKKVCGGSTANIGLGADYDGIVDTSRGLEDVSMVPRLTAELIHRGYTDEEIGGILGMNLVRVLERCEEVSKEMKAEGMIASDALLGDIEPKHAKPERKLE